MSTSGKKLKKFRDRINQLTIPIRENFSRIGELDRECVEKQMMVESLVLPMVQHWTKTRREIRQKRYKALKNALEKLEQLANEKVKIASQSYEEIDKCVVQLDKLYAKELQKQVPFDPTTVVDMPVDPNEPTYCVCRQVSFGQMIACENKSCPVCFANFLLI
ncbi:Inhibitor of growth protein 5-like protein [Aphelenchoides besseyi]|nr:Inhibitor of growth protein 5-like protein [Aphelenchoides besseyi]